MMAPRGHGSQRRADLDEQLDALAALGEPIRRALYRFVAAQVEPVSRESAAAAVGVPVHVAKFHLDRLAADGLLACEYRRPPGRSGPGAGRPRKLYRRTGRDIAVSLPERHYDLAARVLAQAVTVAAATGRPLREALASAARETGRRLGQACLPSRRQRSGLRRMCDALADHGYEPQTTGGRVTLANCPFHSLAGEFTELVCGVNLELITGLADELSPGVVDVRLDPAPDRCCVTVSKARHR
jgi:predicted ArsR family transcriptional regulator